MMKKLSFQIVLAVTVIILSSGRLRAEENASTCDSINIDLTSKFRFLGDWGPNGTPLYLEAETGEVSDALIDYVNEVLPEKVSLPDTHAEYFGDNVQLNTELTESSKVYLTMVHEGANWENTLGFYTYDIDNPPATVYDIDSLVIIFPNVTDPNSITQGDRVLLGEFPEKTGIGYFLIAKGWVGDTICLSSYMVFSDTHFNTFTTEEYRQHTVLLNFEQENKILLGFEDTKRPDGPFVDDDFNDAVFYITTKTSAIDTTNIPKIPTALLSGDTTICDENAPATLKVELTGQAPWTIVYNDGIKNIEISNIEDSVFTFETIKKDTITLVSVNDNNKKGVVLGQAVINFSEPTATLDNYSNECGEDEAIINLSLTGQAPWTVLYKLDGQTMAAQANEASFALRIGQSGLFELTGIVDANCENKATGSVALEINNAPTAQIGDDVSICQGEEATVKISLTGTAPFTLVYTDGKTETTVTTDEKIYEFTTQEPETFTLVSIEDANCIGKVDGVSTILVLSEDIQVEIDAPNAVCDGNIELSLIGDLDAITIKWTTEGKGSFSNTDKMETIYTPATDETGIVVFYAEVNNGCSVKTVSKEIEIVDELDASFTVSPDNNLLTKTQITFTPSNSNYQEYNWDFGDGNSSNSTISSTEYSEGGIYTVELTVNVGECEASESMEIEVLLKGELFVPNAFNPSAQHPDNQVVKVYGNNVNESSFSFKIINRWGKIMYQTNSFAEANSVGWNGVNNINNEEQELNVFTYVLKGNFIGGESFEKTGTITQIK